MLIQPYNILLLLGLHAQRTNAWCCRSCGKCMCELYGVCPAPASAEPPPTKALEHLSAAEVAAFVKSLGPDGARQTCPPTCAIVNQFSAASAKFLERGIHGHELLKLVHAHSHPAWVHNSTLRQQHADYLASVGVFAKDVPKASEKAIAMMTRLRDAFKHAGYATSSSSSSHEGQGGGGGEKRHQLRAARRAQQRHRREK